MTTTPQPDSDDQEPRCIYCDNTGYRASREWAWYDQHPDMITTWFPCGECKAGRALHQTLETGHGNDRDP